MTQPSTNWATENGIRDGGGRRRLATDTVCLRASAPEVVVETVVERVADASVELLGVQHAFFCCQASLNDGGRGEPRVFGSAFGEPQRLSTLR